jgi:hypothetical protein
MSTNNDPLQRRLYWKERYNNLLLNHHKILWSNNTTTLTTIDNIYNGDQIVNDIINSLHDPWSEIRNDSSKALTKLCINISFGYVLKMTYILLNCLSNATVSWQALHGSIQGLKSLSILLTNSELYKLNNDNLIIDNNNEQENSEIYDTLTKNILSSCLNAMKHTVLPVREASRICIISYLGSNCNLKKISICNFVSNLFISVTELVTSDIKLNTEISANTLHGMIGIIIDLIENCNSSEEFYFFIPICSNTTTTTTSNSALLIDNNNNNNNTNSYLLNLIFNCLIHNSSTVRQRTGQLLSSLYNSFHKSISNINNNIIEKTKEMSDLYKLHSNCIDEILNLLTSSILNNIINTNNDNSWQLIEVCLLVTEEFIQGLINDSLQDTNYVKFDKLSISFQKLLSSIRKFLSNILLHNKFEIRRMGTQLLPTLARATILFDTEGITDSNIWKDLLVFDNDNNNIFTSINNFNISTGDNNSNIFTISKKSVGYAWASEISKAIQHLVELSHIDNSISSIDNLEIKHNLSDLDIEDINLSSINDTNSNTNNDIKSIDFPHWAMKIRGRLLEEELKVLFHNGLKQLINSNNDLAINELNNILKKSILKLYNLAEITIFVEQIPVNISKNENNGFITPLFLSADYIESILLILAVLLPINKHNNDIDLFNIDALSIAICQLSMLQSKGYENSIIDCQIANNINLMNLKALLIDHNIISSSSSSSEVVNTLNQFQQIWEYYQVSVIQSITDPSHFDPNIEISSTIDISSTNRWLCESLAPILPTLAMSLPYINISAISASSIAIIICKWSTSISYDSLWLDNRATARKSLFDSIPILIESIYSIINKIIGFSYIEKNSLIISVFDNIWQIIISSLDSKCKTTLDLHNVYCLIHASKIISQYYLNIYVANNIIDNDSTASIDLKSFILNQMKKNYLKFIKINEYYSAKYPFPVSSNTLNNTITDNNDNDNEEEACVEAEEFSDWDESSDEGDDFVNEIENINISSSSINNQITEITLLHTDISQLIINLNQ